MRARWGRFVVLATVMTLSACSGQPPVPTPPASATLTGHVTRITCPPQGSYCLPGLPMVGVTIIFTTIGGLPVSGTQTNDAGVYTIELPPGTYGITLQTVGPPGDGPNPNRVTVSAGQRLTLELSSTFQTVG